MKKIMILLIPLLFVSCNRCEEPACLTSTEFRFNLVDSFGEDLLFGESSSLMSSDLSIASKDGSVYNLSEGSFANDEQAIIAELNGEIEEYLLIIKSDTVDSFIVHFEELQDKHNCCPFGYFTINSVIFNQLETSINNATGSTNLIIN
jgi:hypothetical protein